MHYYNRHKFHFLAVTHDAKLGRVLTIMTCPGDWPDAQADLPAGGADPASRQRPGAAWQPRSTARRCSSAIATGDGWKPVGPVLDASVISDEGGRGEHGSFTGAFVGMAAFDTSGAGIAADFDHFRLPALVGLGRIAGGANASNRPGTTAGFASGPIRQYPLRARQGGKAAEASPSMGLSSDWNESAGMTARDSLTKNQLCVLTRLEGAVGPLSAYTLLDQLRDDGFRAPLQVYRALDSLMKGGFVHRLESLNAFVACAEPHDHSHRMTAFAICDICGQVSEFSDHDVGAAARRMGRVDRFCGQAGGHRVPRHLREMPRRGGLAGGRPAEPESDAGEQRRQRPARHRLAPRIVEERLQRPGKHDDRQMDDGRHGRHRWRSVSASAE